MTYQGSNGRTVDWFPVGFAPRKGALVLYLMGGLEANARVLADLGPHKVGGGVSLSPPDGGNRHQGAGAARQPEPQAQSAAYRTIVERNLMAPRTLLRAFLALYVTLGIVVLVQSVQTIIAAGHGAVASSPDRIHAILVGSVEAIAALVFLVPRTMGIGANTLLAVFALAFSLHAIEGHPNLTLLVYAAAVLFVRIHGVRGYGWKAVT